MRDIVSVADARRVESVGREVVVRGWVRTRRDSKAGFSFIEINDGSCFGNIQVIADAALPDYKSEIKRLSPGSSVSVDGLVKASPGKGQATEIHAAEVVVHGLADVESYPLQKKGHSFEFLRTIAHLRPRTNTFGAVARVRNRACNSIHQFFAGARVPLRPHPDHHRQRLRRGRGHVPGHRARSGRRSGKGHEG